MPFGRRKQALAAVCGKNGRVGDTSATIKSNRRVDQFMRRGRAAVHSELRLVAATHNVLKLHSHWIANTA